MRPKIESFNNQNMIRFLAGLLQPHMPANLFEVCVWVFDAGVFVGYFCSTVQLGLVVFGTLMKRMVTKRGFFLSEGIVCVIGLSECFISRAQNGCVKFAAQALLNWQ